MAPPRLNGRYEIVRRLGSGAEAVVFLVRDHQQSGVSRALKLVTNVDVGVGARLAGEFRRLTRLEHPHLVRVYDLDMVREPVPGFVPGTSFFTCDYVAGDSPADRLAAAGDRVATLLDIAEQLAHALAHVHAAGLVHCDVKPGNILVQATTPVRAMLLDLGLSCARGVHGVARGTLAYMAPEALSGVADPRADLYALGATLYELACGSVPFAMSETTALVRAICQTEPAELALRCDWLPRPLADLIMRLLSKEAAERHSHAGVLIDDLARVREALERPSTTSTQVVAAATLLPPRIIGREPALAAMRDLFLDVARGQSGARFIHVVGPAGVGKRAVVREAVRRYQLSVVAGESPVVQFVQGNLSELAPDTAPDTAETDAPDPRALQRVVDDILDSLAHAVGREPTMYVVTDAGGDERVPAFVRALDGHATLIDRAIGFVVLGNCEANNAPATPFELIVPPLTEPQLAELAMSMVGRPLAREWVAGLARASDGLPRVASEIVRAVAAQAGVDHIDNVSPETLDASAGAALVGPLYVRRVASLARADAAIIEAIAVSGGTAELATLAATLTHSETECAERLGGLAAAGLVHTDRTRSSLPSSHHTEAICAALPTARDKALRRAALAHMAESGHVDVVRTAAHRLVTGPAAQAASACAAAAHHLTQRGQFAAALPYARHATTLAMGTAATKAKLNLAELATAVGGYDEAISAASDAARSRNKQSKQRARTLLARAYQKSGDLERAAELMASLLVHAPEDQDLRGNYSRLLISRGSYAKAIEVAGAIDESDDSAPSPADAMRIESVALAHLYSGNMDAASQLFDYLEKRAQRAADRSLVGRALGLRGMVAQMAGRVAEAARLYERAEEAAQSASDVHAAAVYALNRATAQATQGRHGDALAALGRAEHALRRLGKVAELAAVKFNRGLALLALGEIAAARRAASQALALARAEDALQMQIYARLLQGDVELREGDTVAAAASYRHAMNSAAEAGGRDLLMTQLNLARVLAMQGDRQALALLVEAKADSADDVDRIALMRGRVALDLTDTLAATELDGVCEHARQAGSVDLAWRADLVAARLALAGNDDDGAKQRCVAARQLADTIVAATPEARRPGLATDPDLIALRSLETQLHLSVAQRVAIAVPRSDEQGHLRRLLSLSRRLNSELRLTPLLDEVIDAVIDLTSAERGFLLLYQPAGELEVLVARNFDQSSLSGDEVRVSRSIAEKSARTGQVVLTVDAAFDERFGAADSVAALRLRSVLAVPLRQKGRVTGTLYVDHRFRRGAFDDEAVELVRELADIAAVAIENARLVEENQRRQQAITELNRRLEDEVTAKDAELATVKARLAADPQLGLRHAYDGIIGRSAPMLAMLRNLDRATATNLPVVICGESGTGKELVARALHQNGPRRNGPFVAVNCGAVAEELLESELFGHVRGAFTSAARDRHGLFEVADGGTLFLDEVADTSLAMQAKLLRVLQEGEIRRVGDHEVRKIDVRVVAATNRALTDMVAAGAFREDLFYRLNVLQLELPPLRQRREDIPTLTEHLLAKLSPDNTAPKLTKAALARLAAYEWPGNVRELENELARATALGGAVLDVDVLSPHIATLRPTVQIDATAELQIKPQVETLERGLVEEALRRTNNNQTAAAKLLGLSRYGLQKKLKRYGIARASSPT